MIVVNSSGVFYPNGIYDRNLYLKWYNVSDNAKSIRLIAKYYIGETLYTSEVNVGPFTLNMPAPTFNSGESINIPCNNTNSTTISLFPYINTVNNGYDQGLIITDQFEWTLPTGWQTAKGETGSFISGSSIDVIAPSSFCTESISVKAYANAQKSNPTSLLITRYIPIEESSFSCSSSTFTINNLPPVNSIVWTCGPNLTISSGQNTVSCTFSSAGSGSSWIKAMLVTSCGNVTLPQKEVWIGLVEDTKIVTSRVGQAVGAWAQYHILCSSGSTAVVAGYDSNSDGEPMGDIGYLSSQSITAYEWSFPSGWSYWSTSTGVEKPNQRIQVSSNSSAGTIQVGIRAQNTCGWTNWKYDTWQKVSCSSSSLMISPNPSASETTIELVTSDGKALAADSEWDLEVYDAMQNLKAKIQKIKGNTKTINASGWRVGVYVVRVKIGDEIITGKLSVN